MLLPVQEMDGLQGRSVIHLPLESSIKAFSAHLPYLLVSPHYKVVALCNSSVESAEAALKRHSLPSSTKTYGSPEDLANDPDVDLVVCCVRVDRHYDLMMPSIKAGKDVFVEWPLASNLRQAEEMQAAAKKSGSKTIVGLQARPSPFVQKIKELVEGKAIGDLLSSNLNFTIGIPGDVEPPAIDYMTKKEVGGNFFTIMFGHTVDSMFYALGGLEDASALLTTRWPETKLLKADLSFDRIIKRETPDHIMLQGIIANNNAPITIAVRSGKGFKDTPNLTWRIFGTKGEIRLTSMASLNLGIGGDMVELYDHDKDAIEVVDVQYPDVVKDLSPFAKHVGLMYELFAKGGSVNEGFVAFEQAVGMHQVLNRMEKSSEGGKYEHMKV
jgi:predicted dehydrogenase